MPDALTLIQDPVSRPTYDELLLRDPKTLTRDERRLMVEHLRQERAQWQSREQAKADKKAEKENG